MSILTAAAHRRNSGSFDPVSLFSSGEQGVIYDVQDITTMWQDAAGTVAAVVDSPVGRIDDISGNGNHAVQATSGKRLALKNSTARGNFLESDGVEDFLKSTFAVTYPFTRISVVEMLTSVTNAPIFCGDGYQMGMLRQRAGQTLAVNDGEINACSVAAPRLNSYAVITEVHDGNGPNSSLAVNEETPTTGETSSPYYNPNGLCLFGSVDTGAYSAGRLYGVVMINRVLTDAEKLNVRDWLTRRWSRYVTVDGDSNSSAGDFDGYAVKFIPNASPGVFLQNLAIPGTGFDTNVPNDLVTAARVANIDARIPAAKNGRQYVYFPWWNNNMPLSANYLTPLTPRTASEMADAVAAFLVARKAAGWDKVGIGTLCERTSSQDNTTTRHAYNNIISAPGWIESKGIDFLVDFAADPIVGADGASLDLTLCSDGVHWTELGHTYLEAVFRAKLNSL